MWQNLILIGLGLASLFFWRLLVGLACASWVAEDQSEETLVRVRGEW